MSIDNPKYLLVELHPDSDALDLAGDIVHMYSEVATVVLADDDGFGRIVQYPNTMVDQHGPIR